MNAKPQIFADVNSGKTVYNLNVLKIKIMLSGAMMCRVAIKEYLLLVINARLLFFGSLIEIFTERVAETIISLN